MIRMEDFIKQELKFLNGKDMRFLVHEADLESCQAKFRPLEEHKKFLQELLKHENTKK